MQILTKSSLSIILALVMSLGLSSTSFAAAQKCGTAKQFRTIVKDWIKKNDQSLPKSQIAKAIASTRFDGKRGTDGKGRWVAVIENSRDLLYMLEIRCSGKVNLIYREKN